MYHSLIGKLSKRRIKPINVILSSLIGINKRKDSSNICLKYKIEQNKKKRKFILQSIDY